MSGAWLAPACPSDPKRQQAWQGSTRWPSDSWTERETELAAAWKTEGEDKDGSVGASEAGGWGVSGYQGPEVKMAAGQEHRLSLAQPFNHRQAKGSQRKCETRFT